MRQQQVRRRRRSLPERDIDVIVRVPVSRSPDVDGLLARIDEVVAR